jgi:hypothetical protein
MLGHEYARVQVRDHLMAHVPGRLGAIRDRLAVTEPSNPAAYPLMDSLPIDASQYPIVMVQSTSLMSMRATEAGQVGVWICEYDVTVVAACRAAVAGQWEDASRQRDRLLLAVRESLMVGRELSSIAYVLTQGLTEEIGEAMQDVQGRPLAAGQVTVRVRVAEELTDDIATVTHHEVVIDPITTNPLIDITPEEPTP